MPPSLCPILFGSLPLKWPPRKKLSFVWSHWKHRRGGVPLVSLAFAFGWNPGPRCQSRHRLHTCPDLPQRYVAEGQPERRCLQLCLYFFGPLKISQPKHAQKLGSLNAGSIITGGYRAGDASLPACEVGRKQDTEPETREDPAA